MPARWPAIASSRPLLLSQLGAASGFVALCLIDVALVKSHVGCDSYRRWSSVSEILAPIFVAGAAAMLLFRAVGQLWERRLKGLLLSLGILALECGAAFGVVWLTLDTGLFYCAFDGVQLPACLLGCPH